MNNFAMINWLFNSELKNVLNKVFGLNMDIKQLLDESRDNKNINQGSKKILSFIMKTWFRFACALHSLLLVMLNDKVSFF